MKSKGIKVQEEVGGSYFDDVKKDDDVLFWKKFIFYLI